MIEGRIVASLARTLRRRVREDPEARACLIRQYQFKAFFSRGL